VGIGLLVVLATALFLFGKAPKPNFDAEHKAQIQRIANEICAAASEKSCELSWGGKSKWFGTLQPVAASQGKVGLDHIRKALPKSSWQESSEPNGIIFKSEKYEVFYSSQSGAVAITSTSSAESQ
jgi:glutamate 5-kinase